MVFSLFNSSYGIKDFKDKKPEEIVEMKVNKIDEHFLETSAKDKAEEFKELTPETKAAIQLLIDLKHKINIYNKYYKPGASRRSITPGHRSPHASHAQPAPLQALAEQMPAEEAPAEQEMVGGRSRRRKGGRKNKKTIKKRKHVKA
jgi:hypothetical protein